MSRSPRAHAGQADPTPPDRRRQQADPSDLARWAESAIRIERELAFAAIACNAVALFLLGTGRPKSALSEGERDV